MPKVKIVATRSKTGIGLMSEALIRAAGDKFIAPAVAESALQLQRAIQQRFPVGATGIGRASIQSRTDVVRGIPAQYRGEVFSALPYVQFVEEGTRPGRFPPIRPLKLWARRVLGNEQAAYAVQRAIHRRGTRPQKVFATAERQQRLGVLSRLRAAGMRWEAFFSE